VAEAFSGVMRTGSIVPLEVAQPVSFEELFLIEREPLYGAMWLVTRDRDEAEEIAQEAFLRVWERWDRVRSMDDPAGYLYRTAFNVWRSRRRRAAVALRKAVHGRHVDDASAEVEARDVVVRALSRLTTRQRAAVVLVDLLDLPSEDAAAAMGIRPSTVRVLASRARATLREGMEPR
jgi:RNA polymerase sigma-70 factor, ECF subfamily